MHKVALQQPFSSQIHNSNARQTVFQSKTKVITQSDNPASSKVRLLLYSRFFDAPGTAWVKWKPRPCPFSRSEEPKDHKSCIAEDQVYVRNMKWRLPKGVCEIWYTNYYLYRVSSKKVPLNKTSIVRKTNPYSTNFFCILWFFWENRIC